MIYAILCIIGSVAGWYHMCIQHEYSHAACLFILASTCMQIFIAERKDKP